LRTNVAWYPHPKSPTSLSASEPVYRRICLADNHTPSRSMNVGVYPCPNARSRVLSDIRARSAIGSLAFDIRRGGVECQCESEVHASCDEKHQPCYCHMIRGINAIEPQSGTHIVDD